MFWNIFQNDCLNDYEHTGITPNDNTYNIYLHNTQNFVTPTAYFFYLLVSLCVQHGDSMVLEQHFMQDSKILFKNKVYKKYLLKST